MWQPTHVKVTVKQARSLITKGKNGTNDVFVVIGIGKEKYQTSIKEKALPTVEWREECELAIPTQGNVANIQLTVYHHNAIGLDEFLGQVVLPLIEFDVYAKPKYRSFRLKGKPEKDKKKGEKERGELEVMINFTVKSGSNFDISKKEKQKSSLTSLKHIGGSLMSIGAKEKQGLKNFAKSVSSRMDKIAKPKRKKSKTPSENSSSGLSNDLMISQQRYGDADPGVISDDDDDDFKFDDDVRVNTRTSSPMSTMSRGSSLMHDQVLDTDFEVGSYEDPEHDFSYSFGKPPRIVDVPKGTKSPHEFKRMTTEKITSFSDPNPSVQIRSNTPEISHTIIEEEPSFDLNEEPINTESSFLEQDQNFGTIDLGPPIELPRRTPRKIDLGGLRPVESKDSFSSVRSFGDSHDSFYSPNEENSFHSVDNQNEEKHETKDSMIENSTRNEEKAIQKIKAESPKKLLDSPKIFRKFFFSENNKSQEKEDSKESLNDSFTHSEEVNHRIAIDSPKKSVDSPKLSKKFFFSKTNSKYQVNEEHKDSINDTQSEVFHKIKVESPKHSVDSPKKSRRFFFSEDDQDLKNENLLGTPLTNDAYHEGNKSKSVDSGEEKFKLSDSYHIDDKSKDQKQMNEIIDESKPKITQDSAQFNNHQNETGDGRDSAISLSHDPDSLISSAMSSRPRSNSNASSIISSASETKDLQIKSAIPSYMTESSPKTLPKSSSDLDVLLRQMSSNKKKSKHVISSSDASSSIDLRDSQIVRSGSLSERRPSVGANPSVAVVGSPPTMIDEWERKLYGRSGMTGSTENVSINGSRSSLNTSRESSIHDVRKEDSFTRLPEVKALTLEKISVIELEDDGKKQKRKPKTGFKNRFFNKTGGSRERLNEDSRFVEGGNDRLPTIPSRHSKLPQEVHDKFAGKSREDLLEVILNLQSSLEKQVKHSSDLEEYLDNLLLRVMEATPHILQAPVKTGPAFKYDRKALGYF